ncbi:MAG: hypothetical protein sL5_09260 [Candidatus Mesenet longicola]|uniref:Uncharacterized protein n=1 Tax=Candidatus Mesenet longicola TaxID=1892558 RepID=A0A8J3HTF1_9RICK|nr:MAG: hypothetical protein sGL2_09830 [Candidatus Mesenet longicola]GHM59933.1 MAG: hypothetical protein sL5_09260 [Candidatus Mesenet longicola]
MEAKSIIGIRNINLEKYASAEKPQIYIKPSEYDQKHNHVIRAFLYDIDNNQIGSLSGHVFHCRPDGDTLFISYSSLKHQEVIHFQPSTNNVFAEKIDGEFEINHPDKWLDANSYTRDYNNLDVDYDLLDKIIMEQQKNDRYCQLEELRKEKEALCKELDGSSMMMSGQHHPCISELAKANFAIEPATYDIDTYM